MSTSQREGFKWNGLFWVAKIDLGNTKLQVGIEAKQDDLETVAELEPYAIRFAEFWSKNQEHMIIELKTWLKDDFGSIATSERCSLQGAKLKSAWHIRNVFAANNAKIKYFNLLVGFEDAKGAIFGPYGRIEFSGRFDDDLRIASDINFEIVSV